MILPNDRKYTQINRGDLFGFLGDTRNMNLDVPGKAILSRKPITVMSSVVDNDFLYPIAINYFSANYTVLTSDNLFEGGLNGTTWNEVSNTPAGVGLNSDALVFNGYLYVTIDDNLSRWNGSATWNNSLASLTSGVPHPMCIFESLTTYQLAIGNGNTVKTYDTSHNANATILTLDSKYQVTTIRYRNGYLYVGTRNLNGGEAKVFIWNGDGVNPQYECPVGAEWIFSMCEYGSSVAVVTSQGELLQINGSSAERLAAFPVFYKPDIRWQGSGGLQYNGKCFNRGMVAIGDNIYINIEGDTDTGFILEMKSGIWVYDPVVGLNHRATSVSDAFVRDTTFTVSDSTITTSTSHNLKTGDAVMFSVVGGITGVDNDHIYYVTVIDANEIKLSLSRTAVEEERYVTIAGAVSGDVLVLSTNTEYGSLYSGTSGAIARTVYNETPLDHWTSEVLWGCRTRTQAGDAIYVVNTFTDSYNVGTIQTQRISADEYEETFNYIYSFIDGLRNDIEEIVVKTQTHFQEPSIILNGVWADEDHIAMDIPLEFNLWKDIREGDELVLTDGRGQGRSCHVVDIGESLTVITLEVDEEFGVAGQDVEFYFTNFKKMGRAKVNEDKDWMDYVKSELGEVSTGAWMVIKLEFRGFRIALNLFNLSSSPHSGDEEDDVRL